MVTWYRVRNSLVYSSSHTTLSVHQASHQVYHTKRITPGQVTSHTVHAVHVVCHSTVQTAKSLHQHLWGSLYPNPVVFPKQSPPTPLPWKYWKPTKWGEIEAGPWRMQQSPVSQPTPMPSIMHAHGCSFGLNVCPSARAPRPCHFYGSAVWCTACLQTSRQRLKAAYALWCLELRYLEPSYLEVGATVLL
jgi:hypothetical protein